VEKTESQPDGGRKGHQVKPKLLRPLKGGKTEEPHPARKKKSKRGRVEVGGWSLRKKGRCNERNWGGCSDRPRQEKKQTDKQQKMYTQAVIDRLKNGNKEVEWKLRLISERKKNKGGGGKMPSRKGKRRSRDVEKGEETRIGSWLISERGGGGRQAKTEKHFVPSRN